MRTRKTLDVPIESDLFILNEIGQVVRNSGLVKSAWYDGCGKQAFDFGRKQKTTVLLVKIIERLNSEVISSTEKRLTSTIPDGKRKISDQPLRTIVAPLFISCQNHMAVRSTGGWLLLEPQAGDEVLTVVNSCIRNNC